MLFRSLATTAPIRGPTARYYRQLTRMSAAFALISDTVLLTYGGKFKFKEKHSGRLADALVHLYLASAVLKRFEDNGRPSEELPLVHWAIKDSLLSIQESLLQVMQNLPLRLIGQALRLIVFPFGRSYRPPDDKLGRTLARILQTENPARDTLLEGIYRSDADDAQGRLERAFHLALDSAEAEQAIRNAMKQPVTPSNHDPLVKRAVESGVITEEQATRVRQAQKAALAVIMVDEFDRDEIENRGGETHQP